MGCLCPLGRKTQPFRPIKERLDGGRIPGRAPAGRRLAYLLEHVAHLLKRDVRTRRSHRGHQRREAIVFLPRGRPFQDGLRQQPLGNVGPGCAHEALQRPAPRVQAGVNSRPPGRPARASRGAACARPAPNRLRCGSAAPGTRPGAPGEGVTTSPGRPTPAPDFRPCALRRVPRRGPTWCARGSAPARTRPSRPGSGA